MKLFLVTAVISILLSSCLKQSIPDAMLNSENSGGQRNVTATLSYKVNGNAVNLTVPDAESQDSNYYTLGCTKSGGYVFDAITSSGEFTYNFFSDSLTVGNYVYTGSYGDMFFMDYNDQAEYAHYATDSMSFHVTSYKNGLISGNFSGQLSPLISDSNPNYSIYGTPGSILITDGSFQNVPVFY
jgi:hypothetical protein